MRKSLVLGTLAVGFGLLAAVLLVEGALRVVTAVDHPLRDQLRAWDPLAVEIRPNGPTGYRQRPSAVFHYANNTTASSNALGYRGPIVSAAPAAGVIRILLFGGSTTHGYGVNDDQTIDAYMRALLPAKYPGRRFEVVNLAFDGYDSWQDLLRLQSDGFPLHPSIVILNTGINDVRNAWFPHLKEADRRTLIWGDVVDRLVAQDARGGPTLWTRIKHYSMAARLPGYILNAIYVHKQNRSRNVGPGVAEPGVAPPVALSARDSSGPPYPDAASLFDAHIRRAVSLSLANGATVLLSTPPSALRSYKPTATSVQGYWVWNAKITQDYRDTLAARLEKMADEEQRAGHGVRYVAPSVPLGDYIDDCHLKPPGNEAVARTFVDAIAPLVARFDSARTVALEPTTHASATAR